MDDFYSEKTGTWKSVGIAAKIGDGAGMKRNAGMMIEPKELAAQRRWIDTARNVAIINALVVAFFIARDGPNPVSALVLAIMLLCAVSAAKRILWAWLVIMPVFALFMWAVFISVPGYPLRFVGIANSMVFLLATRDFLKYRQRK